MTIPHPSTSQFGQIKLLYKVLWQNMESSLPKKFVFVFFKGKLVLTVNIVPDE
jgi:hypothetical protein